MFSNAEDIALIGEIFRHCYLLPFPIIGSDEYAQMCSLMLTPTRVYTDWVTVRSLVLHGDGHVFSCVGLFTGTFLPPLSWFLYLVLFFLLQTSSPRNPYTVLDENFMFPLLNMRNSFIQANDTLPKFMRAEGATASATVSCVPMKVM